MISTAVDRGVLRARRIAVPARRLSFPFCSTASECWNERWHMEIIQGKHTFDIDAAAFAARLRGYRDMLIDLGTGDGRYVRHVAAERPAWFVIGVDACRENLRHTSRSVPRNVLFAIANAQALPPELYGLATEITLNFPWGSLLRGLIESDPPLLAGLHALARPSAVLQIRLNGGAVTEAGWELAAGAQEVRRVLRESGWEVAHPVTLDAAALRRLPSTWARRLAFGRDPRAIYLRGAARGTVRDGAIRGRSVSGFGAWWRGLVTTSPCQDIRQECQGGGCFMYSYGPTIYSGKVSLRVVERPRSSVSSPCPEVSPSPSLRTVLSRDFPANL